MILIKNIEVYSPKYLGKKDVFLAGGKIMQIADSINLGNLKVKYIDGTNKILSPGFIDQHVHLTGGGGEGGFHTRTPEVPLSQLLLAGTTSVVGLLGTDSVTRSLENLLAKVKALRNEGISAYMLSGAYSLPSSTLTGSIEKDISLFEEVLGLKLAISDHRASYVDEKILEHLASEVRRAGMFSQKHGVLVLHMGDGKKCLTTLWKLLEESEIPIHHFLPTHVNRKKEVWEDALRFLHAGGYIDITSSFEDDDYLSATQALNILQEGGYDLSRVTLSTDGYGSAPVFDERGKLVRITYSPLDTNYKELKRLFEQHHWSLEMLLPLITSNVARFLGLTQKGKIEEGLDADCIVLNQNFEIEHVIARGELCLSEGRLLKKGTYEE